MRRNPQYEAPLGGTKRLWEKYDAPPAKHEM